MSDSVDLQEFVVGFVVEAEEYLDSVNRNLVAVSEALKQNQSEPRAIRDLFRSLHTIKGLAAMIGADPIVAISHEMESILRNAERAGGKLNDHLLDLLMQGTRAIEQRVRATSERGVAGIPQAPASLVEALAAAQVKGIQPVVAQNAAIQLPEDILKAFSLSDRELLAQAMKAGRRAVHIEFRPSAENTALGFNITTVRENLSKVGQIIKVVPRSAKEAPTGILFSLILDTSADDETLSKLSGASAEFVQSITLEEPSASVENVPAAETTASTVEVKPEDFAFEAENLKDWAPTDQSSVRVDIRRLDETLERLGELVVTRSKLSRVAAELQARGVDVRDLNSVLAENTRQLKRLRGAITKARMVPLAELFQRLPLVVRGLTKNSDKAVNLVIKVGLSEVDKAVADKIFPAVVHLIRNSFDHAIESKSERARLGKPEVATITVTSDDNSGANMVLTISDDGRGIDREAVAKRAGQPIAKSDDQLLQQIVMPGLSTASELTMTSGRGMGMDIVSRTIEMLGGRLSLSTQSGVGSAFKLNVPVSVTIVDVLSFVSGAQTFAVPLAMVDEILEVDPRLVVPSPAVTTGGTPVQLMQRRGLAIPLISLEALLNKTQAGDAQKALVVHQLRGGTIAFGIDRMIGQQEVVVRPIHDVLGRVKGISGATDLGDGRPTLVVDLSTMGTIANSDVDHLMNHGSRAGL